LALSADGALNDDAFAAALRNATETANSRIHQFSRENPEHRGMGTTATLAGLFGDKLFLAQVGDSRAYLVRNGQARQLTKDQSLMQRLVEAGELTQEEADASERRNIILQALGPDANVTVDLTHQQLRRGDVLLLCSDGLSGLVRADEIASLASSADSVQALCHALVDLANDRGGPDNITVIAARFDGPALSALTAGDDYGYATFPLREDVDPSAETIEARVPQSPFRSDPTPRFGTPLPSAAALEEEFARARAAEDTAAIGVPNEVVQERRRRVQPIFLLLLVLGGAALLWMLYKLLFSASAPR
jgi:protein phosphatase